MTWFHPGVFSLLEYHSPVRLFLAKDQELDGMLHALLMVGWGIWLGSADLLGRLLKLHLLRKLHVITATSWVT